jgi:CheY-like chemotaxis protein
MPEPRADAPARPASATGGEGGPRADGRLAFEVADTGIGIAPEDLTRIFEPFVRLHPGRGASEGAGLGLTLSRGLVTLLGGELSVRSEPGRGTCFTVNLPVEVAAASNDFAPAAAPEGLTLAPGGPQYRILVVDDSEDSRVVLRQMLEPTGFAVLEATNGQEALDLFATRRPHLVLMDLRMPVMDGPEAAQRMRSEGGIEVRTPIIAVTAHVAADGGPSVLGAGFDDLVYKPFDATELLDKIGKQLGARYVSSPAGTAAKKRGAPGAAAVTPANMAGLPAEWIEEFSKALRRGRPLELFRLIDRNRPAHADLAGALARLVRIHELETLLAVTEGARKEASHG